MSKIRKIGSNKYLPTGAGFGKDTGIIAESAFLDHTHGVFEKWVSVELGAFWTEINPLRVCRAGDICLLEGRVENSTDFSNIIGTLPEEFIPSRGHIFGAINNITGGSTHIDCEVILDVTTNPGELSVWRNNSAIEVSDSIHMNGLIYRLV